MRVARPPSACRTARRPRRRRGSRSSPRRRRRCGRGSSRSPRCTCDTIVARSTRKISRPSSRGEHLRGHRLAGAGLAGEQHLQALGAGDRPLVAPVARARGRGGAGRRRSTAAARAGARASRGRPSGSRASSRAASSPSRERGRLARAEVEVARRWATSRAARRSRPAARPRPPRRSAPIESRNLAATSSVSAAPVRSAQAWLRSAKVGGGASTSSTVRSPSASAAVRLGAAMTVRSARCVDRAQQRVRARPARGPRGPRRRAAGPPARDDQRRVGHRVALARGRARARRRAGARGPSRAATRRPARRGRSAAGSRARSIARTARTASSPARVVRRQRARGAGAVGWGSSSIRPPSRYAASRSATLIGRSASGVCASPSSRSAPGRRSGRVAVERRHDVRRRDALALEQVADEPRARQLARHVVLQVRVQPAVARVELGRRADAEHGGVEQVEPERARRPSAAARRRSTRSRPASAAARSRRRCRGRGTGRSGSGRSPATRSTAAITRRSMKSKPIAPWGSVEGASLTRRFYGRGEASASARDWRCE